MANNTVNLQAPSIAGTRTIEIFKNPPKEKAQKAKKQLGGGNVANTCGRSGNLTKLLVFFARKGVKKKGLGSTLTIHWGGETF